MSIAVELRGPRNTAFAADNNSLLIDEGIYRTPSSGYWLLNYGELIRAPRKKKSKPLMQYPSSNTSNTTEATSNCRIRKRLDFSVVVNSCNTVDSCNPTSSFSEEKEKPNQDPSSALQHCNVLAQPLDESTHVKKVKFADDCNDDIGDHMNYQNVDSPKVCSESKTVVSTTGISVTPSLSKDNTLEKQEGENETAEKASSDWEFDFFTPITDPSYRLGPKPDPNHCATSFANKTDFVNAESNEIVRKKRARKISFSSDTTTFSVGIKRSKSARSLTFH